MGYCLAGTSSAPSEPLPMSEWTVTMPETALMAAKTCFWAMMGTFNLLSLPRISAMRRCSGVISMTLMRVGVSLIFRIFCDSVILGENSKVRRPCFSFLTSSSGSPLTISTRILGVSSEYTKWTSN